MKRIITATALAAILATATACGGEDGNGGEGRLHPILHDVTYLQIQEGREYVTMTIRHISRYLSDRINAIHEEGYEIRHASSDERGYVLLIFRKIPHPEWSVSPTGTTPTN